jgi:hypothetical protein
MPSNLSLARGTSVRDNHWYFDTPSAQSNSRLIVWSSAWKWLGWILTESTDIITILGEAKIDKAWLSCVWDITFPQKREAPCRSLPFNTSGTAVGRVGAIVFYTRKLFRIVGRMPIVWSWDNAQARRKKVDRSCAFAQLGRFFRHRMDMDPTSTPADVVWF